MSGGRAYAIITPTTLTADPGTSGTSLTVASSAGFSTLDTWLTLGYTYTILISWGQTDQEIVTVTARPDSTHFTVVRGQNGTAGQAHAIGSAVFHGVSPRDFSDMPQLPDYWSTFGHSYFQYVLGTFYQYGRADSLFRARLDVEYTNWRNYAVNGSRLIQEGRSGGGWARVMQELERPQRTVFPYAPDGGAYVFCEGINDIGSIPGSTQAQIRAMFAECLRASISRCRGSVYFDNTYTAVVRTTFGAGFTAFTTAVANFCSSGSTATPTLRRATSTTNATITLTLPSDYAGETVAVQFIAEASATVGGTFTISGTAGTTGTFTTIGMVPASAGTHVPMVKRFTTLTSANAGQTIIFTATTVTTEVFYDSWWLETLTPQPVLVLNCARLVGTGYSGYSNTIGDSDVVSLNTTILSVVNEFDGMVQYCDMDAALNKTVALFAADGLHPNETGAARIVDSLILGLSKAVVTNAQFPSQNINVPAPRAGVLRKPRLSGLYYGTEAADPVIGYAPVSGDLFATPFVITEGKEQYNRVAFRLMAGGAATAATIRYGIFDDPRWKGYPDCQIAEATTAGAFSLGTAAGIVQNPANGTGSIFWTMDPGLYWLVTLLVTAGNGQVMECITGPDAWGVIPQLNPGDLSNTDTPIGWVIGGQSTTLLPTVFPSGAFVTKSAPKMALLVI
jgi:hypothetical protein